MITLRGATKDVLAYVSGEVEAGRSEMSYLAISSATTYSLPAVQAAIAVLEKHAYISVERRTGNKPNRYTVISAERRRVVAVAQLVGLVQ